MTESNDTKTVTVAVAFEIDAPADLDPDEVVASLHDYLASASNGPLSNYRVLAAS